MKGIIVMSILAALLGACKASDETNTAKMEWPNTTPIDKSNPYWEFNNNMNANGTQYRKTEVEPGKWQWTIDQEAMESKARSDQARRDLYWALRTRVLTADEMSRVQQMGLWLVTEENVSYYEADKQRELNDALLQQFKLRIAAEKPAQ